MSKTSRNKPGMGMTPKRPFGEVLRELRIKSGYGLREFAKKIGMQPSNLSFVENGRVPAPQKAKILEMMARTLNLEEGSAEWVLFFNSATKHGHLPHDVRKNKDLTELIPLLCRAITESKFTKEQIHQLIKKIKNFKGSL
jgi:transcriptional regulator with XRE-family HTH domain